MLRDLDLHGNRLVQAMRRGHDPSGDWSRWLALAPLGDLSVHLGDLREALGLPPDENGPVARSGFALYRDWLPNSGEEADDRPPFEEYLNTPLTAAPADLLTAIRSPLKG